MLDDRNVLPLADVDPFCFWTAEDNLTGWAALLGKDAVSSVDVSPYAAPARVASVGGLPPLYVDVGGLDRFCSDCVAYASKFAATNIEVELHVYAGLPHGFEVVAPDIALAVPAKRNRQRALMGA